MGIFYLVNHPDLDMRMYSWEVVSCTISIFVAVLLFHTFLTMAHDFDDEMEQAWPKETTVIHVCSNVILFLGCFLTTHGVIWRIAVKAARDETDHRSVACSEHHGKEEEQSHRSLMTERRQQELVCWSTLWAHMSSFAAIHAGGSIQKLLLQSSGTLDELVTGTLVCLLAVVPTWFLLFAVFRIADIVRSHYLGISHVVHEIWDEAAEDAEDDVGCIALSFLICQAVRLGILGVLAGPEGRVPDAICPSRLMTLALFGVAVLSAVVRVMLMWSNSAAGSEREASSDTGWAEYCNRWTYILGGVCAQHFAWCLLFGIVWATRIVLEGFKSTEHGYGINCPSIRAVLTMLVSISGFAIIWIFDRLSDMASLSVEKALRSIIKSIGVLVGFSWEQAFAAGVEDIVESLEPAAEHASAQGHRTHWMLFFVKTGMAFGLSVVVVPAWRMYILRSVLRLRKDYEAHSTASRVRKSEHTPILELDSSRPVA